MADAHRLDRRPDTAVQLGDHLFDFFGRLLGALGQGPDFIRHHREPATLLTRPGSLDGGIERQQVGLFGDALYHLQHTADGLTVAGQLVDHLHRLVDFAGQCSDAALLRLHQSTTAHRFVVDAVGAADGSGGAARHLQGGG
ncbi:hypothetical protein D3C73_1156570 [compost metagenome]